MKTDDLDEILRKMDERDATIDRIVAEGERSLVLDGGWPPRCPLRLVVHRDTASHRIAEWRLTRFEGDEPIGHTEMPSFRAAVKEAAMHWGARL